MIHKIINFFFPRKNVAQRQQTLDNYPDVVAQRTAEEYLKRAMLEADEKNKIMNLEYAASYGSGKARDILRTEYGIENLPKRELLPEGEQNSYDSIRNEVRDSGLLINASNSAFSSERNHEYHLQHEDWRMAFDIYWDWFKAAPADKDEDELEHAIALFDEEIDRVMKERDYVSDGHHLALNILVDYYQHRNLDRAFELTRFGAEKKNPTLSYLYGLSLKEIGSIEEAIEYMKVAQHGKTTILLAKLQLAVMYLESKDFQKYQDDAMQSISSGIDIMDRNKEMRQGDPLLLYTLLGDYYLKRSTLRKDTASYSQDKANALKAFEKAYEVFTKFSPNSNFARVTAERLIDLYQRRGDQEKAEQLLKFQK